LPVHVLLKLALAGALSGFFPDRRQALWTVLATCRRHGDLFCGGLEAGKPPARPPMAPWEVLVADLESASFSLSGHPFELVYPRLAGPRFLTAGEIARLPDGRREVVIGGLAVIHQRPPTAGGLLFVTLEDHTGFHNLVVHPPVLQRHRQLFLEAAMMVIKGRLEKSDGVASVVVQEARAINLRFGGD